MAFLFRTAQLVQLMQPDVLYVMDRETEGIAMASLRYKSIPVLGILLIIFAISLNAQNPETLTEEQMKDFQRNAKVIRAIQSGKGVTSPYRFTLSNGTLTHDGSFQPIDEYKPAKIFNNGKTGQDRGAV
jgi:hypothetical protein